MKRNVWFQGLFAAAVLCVCLLAVSWAGAETLILPEDLTVIEDYAFAGCAQFTGPLIIPDGVTYIGAHAFDGCAGLTGHVILPENLEYVDEKAFNGTGLTVMTYDQFVNCFTYKTEADHVIITGLIYSDASSHILNNLVLPATIHGLPVTEIGQQAFQLGKLTGTLTIPDTVTRINECAFWNNAGLTRVKLPDSAEWIDGYAFANCGLTEIPVWPASLRHVGECAFYNNPNMQGDVQIPHSITYWGGRVFDQTGVNEVWTHYAFDYVLADGEAAIRRLYGTGDAATVFPETIEGCPVTQIGDWSWKTVCHDYRDIYHCTLTGSSLVIPSTVKRIEGRAFLSLGFTGNVIFPEGLEYIGQEAFMFSQITGPLDLPDSLTSIGDGAFNFCSALDGELLLPAGLEYLGKSAFSRCGSLTGDLVIPQGITEIGEETFYACGFNGVLTLPDGLTHIRRDAFSYCPFSGRLILPDSLAYIGHWAFSWTGIRGELVLPSGLKILGDYAFNGADGIQGEIVVPAGITYYGRHVFDGFVDKPVRFEGERTFALLVEETTDQWGQPCYGITGCNNVPTTNLTLPSEYNGHPVIMVDFCALAGCDAIQGTLTIPEGYTFLDTQAFGDCRGLTGTPVIPSTLTKILGRAFQNCSGLTGTIELAEDVKLDSGVFDGSGLTVYRGGQLIYQP